MSSEESGDSRAFLLVSLEMGLWPCSDRVMSAVIILKHTKCVRCADLGMHVDGRMREWIEQLSLGFDVLV